MAKYEALRSFVGIGISAAKGHVVELDDATAKSFLSAGYIKAVAAEEPAPESKKEPAKAPAKKKVTAKKKTTAKKG